MQRERIKEVLSDTSRKRLAPAAREPSQNKVPRYRQAHIAQLSSVATNNLETTPTTPLSYNNNNNNKNSSSSSQQQPQQLTVSSRGLRAAPESSQVPLFRVSNIVLPKYRGQNKRQ
ncbi:hypothetical protein INT45_011248 [Circinella minor]|uniref:Uncharacterized protein n=1 Tax=Circinella minor TaxID=1195481 RepID=A0A8H7RA60_9FUNG|nr:hypothetical protein INT45_011248 [Circinella minor]